MTCHLTNVSCFAVPRDNYPHHRSHGSSRRDGKTVKERLGQHPHHRGESPRQNSHHRPCHSHSRESRHRSRSPVHRRLGSNHTYLHARRHSHTREPRPRPIDCRICGKVVPSLSSHVLQYHSEGETHARNGSPHTREQHQPHPSTRSSHTREAKHCHLCKRLCPNLARHFQRQHKLKKVGYVCPSCRHGCSKYDVGLFRKHLKSHTSSEALDPKTCLVSIPEGYYRPLICPTTTCHYRTLTAVEMDAHVAQHIKEDTILAINLKLGIDADDNDDL